MTIWELWKENFSLHASQTPLRYFIYNSRCSCLRIGHSCNGRFPVAYRLPYIVKFFYVILAFFKNLFLFFKGPIIFPQTVNILLTKFSFSHSSIYLLKATSTQYCVGEQLRTNPDTKQREAIIKISTKVQSPSVFRNMTIFLNVFWAKLYNL